MLSTLLKNINSIISSSENVKKILANISWLFFDKILRMGMGLIVGVWVARYLGPEKFGVLSYSLAFISLFNAFTTLGIEGIALKELSNKENDKSIVLGSVFFLKFIGSSIGFISSLIVIFFLKNNDTQIILMVGIIGFGLIFQSFDFYDYYFLSEVKSKYSVIARYIAFILCSLFKIIVILSNSNLVWFAVIATLEFILAAIFLRYSFAKYTQKKVKLLTDYALAKRLMIEVLPLTIASILTLIYMRIDQVIIGQMINSKEVGIYSVSIKIAEIGYALAVSLCSSSFSTLMLSKQDNHLKYRTKLNQLYSVLFWIGITISIAVTIFSKQIVLLLFGNEYLESVPVLSLYIWGNFLVFWGVATNNYLIMEELTQIILIRTIIGVVINITLNLILIPYLGIIGAAAAFLISYFFNVFSLLAFKRTRGEVKNLVFSLNPIVMFGFKSRISNS